IPSTIRMATLARASWFLWPRRKVPRMGVTTVVLVTVTALLATTEPGLGALPTPISATTARSFLASLSVEPKNNTSAFNQNLFPHWITISGTCDTRETVLKRDGTNVITDSSCTAESGTWQSPYDGATWTDSSDVDIDHVVPLKEAWVSGACLWTTAQRQAFANDLTRPELVAVTDNIVQAKGDQDPAAWMPPLSSYHCTYLCAYVQVKYYYRLTIDSAEKSAISSQLANC
ncbi:hypothetical protein BGX26_008075, partial [Mortierella sp. AD094]